MSLSFKLRLKNTEIQLRCSLHFCNLFPQQSNSLSQDPFEWGVLDSLG